jgi:death-on-curing protein
VKITFLSVKDILLLHTMLIDETGGSHGIRDIGLLESAVGRPEASFSGEDLYPTLFDKTAALCHSLLMNHMIVDGNKRTAMLSAMTFLEHNGYFFKATNKEIVTFALRIENDKLEVEEISSWFQKHSTTNK